MQKRLIRVEVCLNEDEYQGLLIRTKTQVANKRVVITTNRYYRDEFKANFDNIWDEIGRQIKYHYDGGKDETVRTYRGGIDNLAIGGNRKEGKEAI